MYYIINYIIYFIIKFIKELYSIYLQTKVKHESLNTKYHRYVPEYVKKQIASNQQWKCNMCGKMLDATYEIDHIIPLYVGGSNDLSNLMALDPICHRHKTMIDKMKYH